MKRFITLITVLAVAAMSAMSQGGPEITFEKTTHNFGKIPQGTPVTYEFQFTNTGTEPLIVNNVQKTCGCTVTGWTKNPVMPGQTGYVSAQYNAASMGAFKKPVTVVSNASASSLQLFFEGEVVAKTEQTGTPVNESPLTPGK